MDEIAARRCGGPGRWPALLLGNQFARWFGVAVAAASVLRWLFAWAREERIIPANPALELRTGWGGSWSAARPDGSAATGNSTDG